MGYRNYSVANGLVVDLLGNGDFTTIQAAINAASSGQTVFIRPGTYTENPTLKTGVDLVAFVTDGEIPNVIINGTCSYSSAGIVGISGIQLQTNGNFALSVTGSASSQVYLKDCYINCISATGIQFTSSSGSAFIRADDCRGNISTTGIALFANSSAGSLQINNTYITNTGSSTSANTTSGSTTLGYSSFANPFTTSAGGSVTFSYCNINTSAINTTCLTTAGTGTSSIDHTDLISGSASALSIGSGTNVNVLVATRIDSTNTNAITGSGSIQYGNLVYTNSSSQNNVTTQAPYTQQSTGWNYITTQTASASANLSFTNLPGYGYKTLMFVFDNVVVATNAKALNMVVSSNNGSSYTNSGYNTGINYSPYNSNAFTNVNSTTFAVITSNLSNGVGMSGYIIVTINNGIYNGLVTYDSTDAATYVTGACGGELGITPNAYQFASATGNITSGSITLFGLAQA